MQNILLYTLSNSARLGTVFQILMFLPLTLSTISTSAFLILSFLLSIHSIIHGTMTLFWGSDALSFLQLPVHPFLLLLCFNLFASPISGVLWLVKVAEWWGFCLKLWTPIFIGFEGISSLLVAQSWGQKSKGLASRSEQWQFTLLFGAAAAYVGAATIIVLAYPAAAVSPFTASLLGASIASLFFLTLIGFALRRTNVIESAGLALFLAYNVWLCGYEETSPSWIPPWNAEAASYYNMLPHLQTLVSFIKHTLPRPLLASLFYRLIILHLASRILPTIGSDAWDADVGVDGGWEGRPTSKFTNILLTYQQFIFVTVYSHLLLLDHSSQVWWRWANIFFTLALWALELLVTPGDDDIAEKWKVE
ncbi:hypothetical protein M422DRAFT_166584 [Sphaerobolus stellatus SS14]|uniref:Uncharacterized protein n=1 Tax=Sphaerobolus stellatus (strain SS14) TaxID=990650 RepID=A0A0C9VF79_SPHS4|nr:hypothetical protein M422DRAFT_166584 [Sphaerobolus stellatus SS14]